MSGEPTYVIGVGGSGIDVVGTLNDRIETDQHGGKHLGLMAIDSDANAFENRSGVTEIHLKSESVVINGGVEQYPFLNDDVAVPVNGSDRRRHVGRFKFDNPVTPSFQNHRRAIYRNLEQFFKKQQTQLSHEAEAWNIVIVVELGGGTGSGLYPLLVSVVTQAIEKLKRDRSSMRIVGIGIVPPLEHDPTYQLPPVEPVSYLNTYAALRNLSTIFAANPDNPLEIPVYSTGKSSEREQFEKPGLVFEFERPPFDSFWLTSRNPVSISTISSHHPRRYHREHIANAIYTCTANSDHISNETDVGPAFGTIGYAAVRVPHRELTAFCELKKEYCQKQNEIEEFIEPKIKSIKSRLEELRSALQNRYDEPSVGESQFDKICRGLRGETCNHLDFVIENNPSDLNNRIDTIRKRESLESFLETTAGLRWSLEEGSVGSEVRSQVENTISTIRNKYDHSLLPEHRATTMTHSEIVAELLDVLKTRKENYRQALDETAPSVRDLLPPAHDILTSNREQMDAEIEIISEDIDRLSEASKQLSSLSNLTTIAQRRAVEAREAIRSRLDELERELSHYYNMRDKIEGDIDDIERELSTRRENLTDPEQNGPIKQLALSWDALDDITPENIAEELSSIQAYYNRGLLTENELQELISAGRRESRDWPKTLTQHSTPLNRRNPGRKTIIVSHEENSSLLNTVDEVRQCTDLTTFSEPHQIDIVSVYHGDSPESLLGFQRLAEWYEDGVLEAMSGSYNDFQRALAYPEWYKE